jgi:hypothetical protein
VGKAPAGTSRASRGAWSRKPGVDGVYGLEEGAVLDACCHVLRAIGVSALGEEGHGPAIHRAMVPLVQDSPALGAADLVWHGAQQCPAELAGP